MKEDNIGGLSRTTYTKIGRKTASSGTLTLAKMMRLYEKTMEHAVNGGLEPGAVYFVNEDDFKMKKPVYRFSLTDKILHYFGRHIYAWHKEKCIYPGCKDK